MSAEQMQSARTAAVMDRVAGKYWHRHAARGNTVDHTWYDSASPVTAETVSEPSTPHYLLHTHTHPFNGPLSVTTQVSRYQKGKPIWILLEQQTVGGSGISWAIYKSAPCSRQKTRPALHHSVFLQAGCPSCCPTNSVKALKAYSILYSTTCYNMIYLC